MTSAPARRMAETNGPAHVFSYKTSPTALPGSMSSTACRRSSSSRRPDSAPSKTARSSSPSPSKSATLAAVKLPSCSRLTNLRSRIRMIPDRPGRPECRDPRRSVSLGKFNGQVIDWPYILLGHAPPPMPRPHTVRLKALTSADDAVTGRISAASPLKGDSPSRLIMRLSCRALGRDGCFRRSPAGRRATMTSDEPSRRFRTEPRRLAHSAPIVQVAISRVRRVRRVGKE